jgi:lipopolysaccharide assembly outer membrane protein LptD (OstA)
LSLATSLLCFAGAAFSQADKISADEIRYSAISMHADNHVQTLDGEVRIETANVTIRADKAVVDQKTLDIQASGNVHITLKK